MTTTCNHCQGPMKSFGAFGWECPRCLDAKIASELPCCSTCGKPSPVLITVDTDMGGNPWVECGGCLKLRSNPVVAQIMAHAFIVGPVVMERRVA